MIQPQIIKPGVWPSSRHRIFLSTLGQMGDGMASLRGAFVELYDEGKASVSVRRNLPCIQTRYILSCRLRFTISRRSTPSWLIVNRGWAGPSASGSRRDGWIVGADGSSGPGRGLPGGMKEESRLGGVGGGAGTRGRLSSLVVASHSPSPSPFSSSTSVDSDAGASCAATCTVGGAGEPVNSSANSSTVRAYRKEGGGIAGNDTDSRVKNIFFRHMKRVTSYAPSSKKYTRVLSPRM
jgi:hypothetical protein